MTGPMSFIFAALQFLATLLAAAAVAVVAMRLAFPLPERPAAMDALPVPEASEGGLTRSARTLAAVHPGLSGVAPLADGPGAFAARVALIDAAERSVDAQYYIWHDDLTGSILLDALRRAADRGVRVRLLVDDNGVSGLDPQLAQLDAHANATVRLFNPFVLRAPKWLNYVFDFPRLNRRMHNKSLTVDGVAAIVGGRNVGDEYFGAGDAALFIDLDVLAIGRIVPEVAADFERYWEAEAVYPAAVILPAHDGRDLIGARASAAAADSAAQGYRDALARSMTVARLRDGSLPFEWTEVRLVSDDPVKALGRAGRDELMMTRLVSLVGQPSRRLDLVSPYFVPGEEGTAAFAGMEAAGAEMRILTNALETTDVVPVHAGYAKRRRKLLEAGVELFELKRTAPGASGDEDRQALGPFGSSGGSLHAKTFAIDGRWIYVGSFNFDPRSLRLNTEMGFVIASGRMASYLHAAFDERLERVAYRPILHEGGIAWRDGSTVIEDEPGASLPKRVLLAVVSRLPVEWLL